MKCILVNEEQSFHNCWYIEHPYPTLRYSMEGKPISIVDPFVISHAATGKLPASDIVDYYNGYGHEYEVWL
jgi:hypothetical protein